MSTLVWVAQAAMALTFLIHVLLFLFPPEPLRKLRKGIPFSKKFLRFICIAEILGALGLILPGMTGIFPWLTALAAIGLTPIAGGAAVFHLSRREVPPMVITPTLFALAVFVAFARWSVPAL
jgi:hypothetical protein